MISANQAREQSEHYFESKLDKEIEMIEQKINGKDVKLRTYGDLWSFLQQYKFGANSQPYYVVLDNEGGLLSGPYYYDEDVSKFVKFLKAGVTKYNVKNEER